MQKESLNEATRLVVEAIQNSNINVVDKLELLINLSNFLANYHEAIKSDLGRKKQVLATNGNHWKPATKTRTFKRRR